MAIFRVRVTYEDDAHPEQLINVEGVPKTADEAVLHCLKYLHHKGQDGTIYKCKSAVKVRDEPYPKDEAPRPPGGLEAFQKPA